eukprot:4133843-Heterocapsa_arctica.AAC.1
MDRHLRARLGGMPSITLTTKSTIVQPFSNLPTLILSTSSGDGRGICRPQTHKTETRSFRKTWLSLKRGSSRSGPEPNAAGPQKNEALPPQAAQT